LDEEDEEEDEDDDDDEELSERALRVVALSTVLTAASIASSEYFVLYFFFGAAGVGRHKELTQRGEENHGGAQSVPAPTAVVALGGRNVRVDKPRAVLLTVFRFCLWPPGSPMVV